MTEFKVGDNVRHAIIPRVGGSIVRFGIQDNLPTITFVCSGFELTEFQYLLRIA